MQDLEERQGGQGDEGTSPEPTPQQGPDRIIEEGAPSPTPLEGPEREVIKM